MTLREKFLKSNCPTIYTFYWLFCLFSYFYFSVVEFGKQLGEKVSIKDLHALVMLELCQKLNIERAVGCDYRHLAAHFDMSSDDIHLISQKKDPTKEVLEWLGQNPQNTVAKFRETLVKMKRHDCVELIDEKYIRGMPCLWIFSKWRISITTSDLKLARCLNNEKLLFFPRIKHFVMQI